ncbi:uncharacterized protein LOC114315750 [Camellia sinensis]|uniref:uncharacterized protein LOC114315750 n=1 Tax=Camellia sinensis TaxID=4442 RepID=UPI00103602CF|nr:uncharacterized protein LOC114315750 [Camellia sinensis]
MKSQIGNASTRLPFCSGTAFKSSPCFQLLIHLPKTEEVKKELTATSADSQGHKLLCRKLQNCRVALFGICLLGNWFWHGVWIVVDVMYAATNADSQAFSGC